MSAQTAVCQTQCSGSSFVRSFVRSDQSWIINCHLLLCRFLAETEELCSPVVDPADVHSAPGQLSFRDDQFVNTRASHRKDVLAG